MTQGATYRWLRSTAIVACAVLTAAIGSRAGDTPFEAAKVKKMIAKGHPGEALERIEDQLARDPDDAVANPLRGDALFALGRLADAEAGLLAWCDRGPSDVSRIAALVSFYRRAELWDSVAAATPRIAALPEPQRRDELRALVTTLCDAGRCPLAAEPVRRLIPDLTDESGTAVVQALDAASKGEVRRLLTQVMRFPPEQEQAAARREAFRLVSLRAASAVQAPTPRQGRPPELPASGLDDASSAAVPPKRVATAKPAFPDLARRARIEGRVVLRAVVLTTGECLVTGLYTASHPMFIEAAAESAAQWRFEPARDAHGQPIPVEAPIRIDFRLE